jgi:Zn-dependent peptidase ImmA (M78 family)/DNA-binding Xre family transcriptional regulator
MDFSQRLASVVASSLQDARMSAQQLAHATQISLAKIEGLLAARPSVTTRELKQIAVALEIDPGALLMGVREPSRSPAVFMRHASQYQDFQHADEGEIAWVLERGVALAALHPEGNERRRFFRSAALDPRGAAQQGYLLAENVRQRLSLRGPIPDMRSLLEETLAIPVYVRELVTNTPAIAVCADKKAAAAILLNSRRSQEIGSPHTRVSLAHELCHILFDPMEGGLQIIVEEEGPAALQAPGTRTQNSSLEPRARAFAAELLCPKSELSVLFPGKPSTKPAVFSAAQQICSEFGLSLEPALRQLQHRLGVSSDIVRQLLSEHPASQQPPAAVEDSPALLRRARKAWESDRYSSSQVRAFLGIRASSDLPWEQ